jgi:hypothetical protein
VESFRKILLCCTIFHETNYPPEDWKIGRLEDWKIGRFCSAGSLSHGRLCTNFRGKLLFSCNEISLHPRPYPPKGGFSFLAPSLSKGEALYLIAEKKRRGITQRGSLISHCRKEKDAGRSHCKKRKVIGFLCPCILGKGFPRMQGSLSPGLNNKSRF